jgi:ketosteroid isomerase-like protein
MKWLARIVVAGLLTFAVWWLWQRVFVTDEMRIKHQISTMTRAVEKGELLKLSDAIAYDYTDDHGLDKSTLLAAVRGFRAQSEELFIYISDQKIDVNPDALEAHAVIVAKVLSKTKGGGQTELNADRFRLFFRKTDDGWKLSRTESPELKFD